MEENEEIHIPVFGVKEEKIEAFRDLMTRYLCDNDTYNLKAVHNGVYKAMMAVHENKSIIEIIKSVDSSLSGFQLNWVLNTIGEYSTKGVEVLALWTSFQKSLEPKKKPARRYKESPLDFLD